MARKRRVYIASPYTKGDVAVNVKTNIDAGDQIASMGYAVFIPLLTHFWHLISPHPYDFWTVQDDAWILVCDVLVRLPGESSGADAEVKLAQSLNIPVVYSIEELTANHPATVG